MVRLVAAAATALLLALTLAPADASPASRYASQAFDKTNDNRAGHDLKELGRNDCLQKYAKRQATKMARNQTLVHQQLEPIAENCHLGYVGENIAYGYPSGKATVDAWMHSEGHRANILRPQYRLMGLAASKARNGQWYVSQVFGRKA